VGFSRHCIEHFFVPFLGGVFLESSLETSSRFFEFIFSMFAQGDATVPARGMGEISRQLAAGLPPDAVVYDTPVAQVSPRGVVLEDGIQHTAATVVVACEAPAARRLVPTIRERTSRAVTCLYFDAPHPPDTTPILHLRGRDPGPINNLHVTSSVSEQVAPSGRTLISASCIGHHDDLGALQATAQTQLQRWFGGQTREWRPMHRYRIEHALPAQPVGELSSQADHQRTPDGVLLCGDYCSHASINGAMRSGRHAAEAILSERESEHA
jgi:phytoene dehydrogenase-like protein